jgi:putative membrane protein
MWIDAHARQAIEARVAALEGTHGVEVVTTIVGKSDVYPEIVWKAFALGASLAGLAVTIVDLLHPEWATTSTVLAFAVAILGTGAVASLATLYIVPFARLFLRESRAMLEVRQYAAVQFLERELFATPERTAVLLLVSLLERRVVILADKGLRARVPDSEWEGVIARMRAPLRAREIGTALLEGLDAIGELLASKGLVRRSGGNRFPDQPVEVPRP